MCDGVSPFESRLADGPQRAVGELFVGVKRRGGDSVIARLRQAGCLKARFPRPVSPGWLDVTSINSSGGVAGGDRLDVSVSVGSGACATVAGQAAERFYRALPGGAAARVRTAIAVADGAAAEWLPQETILFDRCALDRRLAIDVAPDGWFLGVEMLLFGRAAMGERVLAARLRDRIEVRRGDDLLLHDAIRLDGAVDSVLERSASAAGARAVATVVHVAPDAHARRDAVRDVLDGDSGASAWNGMLIARMVAPDGAALRRRVTAALAVLRDGRPLPRAWLC